jgi:hypothetical protein
VRWWLCLVCACGRVGFDPVAAPSDAGIDLSACPASYTLSGNGAYRRSTDVQVFANAASSCAADQPATAGVFTHLVVIDDTTELDLLNTSFSGNDVWVGLTDIVTAPTYQWVTAEPISVDPALWGVGKPDNPTTEQCVHVIPIQSADPGKLDTIGCTQFHYFICECDAYADDSSRY